MLKISYKYELNEVDKRQLSYISARILLLSGRAPTTTIMQVVMKRNKQIGIKVK